VDRTLAPDAAAAAYERTLRMALELRPSEPPPFDRVVLELSSTGRLGALGADDWERRTTHGSPGPWRWAIPAWC
jgi:hypothetical protein